MGHEHHHDQPRAYSDRVVGNPGDGYTSDRHSIVIEPGKLDKSIAKLEGKLADQSPTELRNTLSEAMGQAAPAFGDIPFAAQARNELQNYVETHLNAMEQMGVSVSDFIARVQAAAKFGYDSDPATVAAAKQASYRGAS